MYDLETWIWIFYYVNLSQGRFESKDGPFIANICLFIQLGFTQRVWPTENLQSTSRVHEVQAILIET